MYITAIDATVVEPRIKIERIAENKHKVLAEITLETFNNKKRVIAKKQYDIASPEGLEGLREILIDLGCKPLNDDDVQEALSELPGLKVTADIFFNDDSPADYLIEGSQEKKRITGEDLPPEDSDGYFSDPDMR